jgi:hypothetical protein
MLERDLKKFKCPQLKSAESSKQCIIFSINKGESANDIERFLQKNAYRYNFDKQRGLLLVEPLHV